MDKKTANIVKYILSGLLAVVLVWFAFRGVDWKAFWEGVQQTRWIWVVLYFVAAILALVFREERWIALMRPLDPDLRRLGVWDAINVGNLVNVVLPGAGEFVRCGYVSSKKMSYEKAFGTIACERLSDIVAVALLVILALVFKSESFGPFFSENIWAPMASRFGGSLGWVLIALVLLAVTFFWAVFHYRSRVRLFGRIADTLKGLGAGFGSIAKMERKWSFLLSTIAIWAMYVLMMFCTIRALPMLDALTMTDALFLSAIGNIASVIPVPGGIGAYHYLVALCTQSLYGTTWETGILLATLGHEAHAILIIIIGVISYIRFSLRKRK
ncbi:MAG: flippase-like domain-containing protein [Bacteroidales bacterium]|nr:flippase-like domain-containing protein [Bacteroidales bacterium]